MNNIIKQQLQWLDDIFNMAEPDDVDDNLKSTLFKINNHISNTKVKITDLEIEKLKNKQ